MHSCCPPPIPRHQQVQYQHRYNGGSSSPSLLLLLLPRVLTGIFNQHNRPHPRHTVLPPPPPRLQSQQPPPHARCKLPQRARNPRHRHSQAGQRSSIHNHGQRRGHGLGSRTLQRPWRRRVQLPLSASCFFSSAQRRAHILPDLTGSLPLLFTHMILSCDGGIEPHGVCTP